MKLTLKAPGTNCLKLEYDEVVTSFAFKSNLRRYILGGSKQPHLHGRAVQLDPMKPTVKAPGTKRLRLKYDRLLSILPQICFQIQLAPLHHGGLGVPGSRVASPTPAARRRPATRADMPLPSQGLSPATSLVGRCRLTQADPG